MRRLDPPTQEAQFIAAYLKFIRNYIAHSLSPHGYLPLNKGFSQWSQAVSRI